MVEEGAGTVGKTGLSKKIVAGVAITVIVVAGVGVFMYLGKNAQNWGAGPPHLSQVVIDSKDNIHILWSANWLGDVGIYYTKMDKNGSILIESKKIIEGAGNLFYSVIIDDSDIIHVITNGDTMLDLNGNVISQNSSIIWPIPGQPVLKDNAGKLHYLWRNGTVDSNGYIHTIRYEAYSQGIEEIHKTYYKKMDYNGTVIIEKQIANISVLDGKVMVDSENNIHVIYSEGDFLYYAKLDNKGNVITNFTKLETGINNLYVTFHTATLGSNDTINVVSHGFINGTHEGLKIYFMKVDKNGDILVAQTKISELTGLCPCVAVDSHGSVHIAFETHYTKYYPIYYLKLDDEGNPLVEEVKIYG